MSISSPRQEVHFTTEELEKYLPHRKPMVWITSVKQIGNDNGHLFGSCSVNLEVPSLFCPDGSILGSSSVELCAQAYGYVKACYHHVYDIDDTPTVTYLTGVKECKANFSKLSENNEGTLKVDVMTTRRMENLTFFRGKISGIKTETLYAEVSLQVYTA